MTVPDPAEQREVAKSHSCHSPKLGETWYVIDAKWYQRWKNYVKVEEGFDATTEHSSESPGPLDNSHLLKDGQLKENLQEAKDYDLIPEPLWDKMAVWYNAGKENTISRKVIEIGSLTKECKVEVYLLKLTVSLSGSHDKSEITCSQSTTVKQLEEMLRNKFNVDATKECRLWASYSTTSEIVKESGTTPLGQLGLNHAQCGVLLEVQQDDGTWPNEGSSKYSSSKASHTMPSISSSTRSTLTNGSDFGHYGNSRSLSSVRGLCGLSNLGNTCFMNSSLQCLSNVPSLTRYFLNDEWEQEVNETNPLGMRGKIARTYADVIQSLWTGRHNSTNPRNFKVAVGDFAPRFSGYQQQDSQELMAFLLDGLHEDLNRVKSKPYVELKEASGKDDETDAGEAWQRYKQRNDSVIVDTFHGLLKSRVVCPEKECSNVSVTFDPFCYLSLPIPQEKDKIMEVVFIPLNHTTKPLRCSVRVPKRGMISDLCSALGKRLDLEPDRLTVTDVYNNKFHKIFNADDPLQHISDKDDIFVYEKTQDEAMCTVTVYLRERQDTSRFFGIPLRVPLPTSEGITYDQLYNSIFDRLQCYLRTDSLDDCESMASAGSPTIKKGEGFDERMDDSSADDPVPLREGDSEEYAGGKKPLFKIYSTWSNSYDEQPIEPDTEIQRLNRATLVIEFDAQHSRRYNIDMQFEVAPGGEEGQLRAGREVTLSMCLDLFTQEEELGASDLWYCPKCKKHVRATKKFDIWSLPDVLVIHLKRFTYNRVWRDKIDVFIQYPTRDLNMAHWVTSKSHKDVMYNLIAVSNHYGGLGGGHYTAFAKNCENGRWYHFDDASVTSADESSVVTKAGYLLIYEKVKHGDQVRTVGRDAM